MTGPAETSPAQADDACFAQFGKIRDFLAGEAASALEHSELESYVRSEGLELLRLLLQDHFDLRAAKEARVEGVSAADGVEHRAVEAGHERQLVHRRRHGHRRAVRLPPAGPGQPLSRRRGVEPSRRAPLPRPARAVCHRVDPRKPPARSDERPA